MLPLPSKALIERLGKAGPRYTSYPPATEWKPFGAEDARAALAAADASKDPLSLYVHLPFCEEMCRFCGCNVIATKDRTRADEYLDILEKELALWAALLPHRRMFSQLHLGGGTPTFLTPPQLERLYGLLRKSFDRVPDAEQALEVDPVVTTDEQIALLGRLGFNRISVGIQDLNRDVQVAVNRIQPAEQTERLIRFARRNGFASVNVDLLYGLPFQTVDGFARTIDRILEMEPDRVALFGYAHVPWVKPNQRLIQFDALPGPYQRVEIFLSAARRLEEAGFRQIGLDHFARESDELAQAQRNGTLTRNFQGYCARAAPETLALGVSSISELGGTFLQNAHKLSEWRDAVTAGRLPVERGLPRTPDDDLRGAAIECIMCLLELDVDALASRFGEAARSMFAAALDELKPLEADGAIVLSDDGLEVTELGRLFLRNVAMPFDAYLPAHRGGRPAFSQTV